MNWTRSTTWRRPCSGTRCAKSAAPTADTRISTVTGSASTRTRAICAPGAASTSGIRKPVSGTRSAACATRAASRPAPRNLRRRSSRSISRISPAAFRSGDQTLRSSGPASPAEEEGIHVHAYKEGAQWPETDETYGTVTIDGITLDQVMVRLYMAQAILPSLKDRVTTVTCTSCGAGILSEGDLAFTPATSQRCDTCERDVPTPGRLRKIVSNPLPLVLAQLQKFAVRPLQKHDLGLLPETI